MTSFDSFGTLLGTLGDGPKCKFCSDALEPGFGRLSGTPLLRGSVDAVVHKMVYRPPGPFPFRFSDPDSLGRFLPLKGRSIKPLFSPLVGTASQSASEVQICTSCPKLTQAVAVLIVHVPPGRAERGRHFRLFDWEENFQKFERGGAPEKERGANFAVTDSILKKK